MVHKESCIKCGEQRNLSPSGYCSFCTEVCNLEASTKASAETCGETCGETCNCIDGEVYNLFYDSTLTREKAAALDKITTFNSFYSACHIDETVKATAIIGRIKIEKGAIKEILIFSGGSGYISPSITIDDVNGSGAAATVEVENSSIKSINIENEGTGYTNADTIKVNIKKQNSEYTFYQEKIIADIDIAKFSIGNSEKDCNANYICIHNKYNLSLTQFIQMFFANKMSFSFATPPQCTDPSSSSWCWPLGHTHTANTDFPFLGIQTHYMGIQIIQLSTDPPTKVIWKRTRADKERDWVWVTKPGTGSTPDEHGWVPKNFLTEVDNVKWVNYNKLGGRDNDPENFHVPYIHDDHLYEKEDFHAQKAIINHIQKDICINTDNWTLCSRSVIYDKLYNLSFTSENFSKSCLIIDCARNLNEIFCLLNDEQKWTFQSGNNVISFNYLHYDKEKNYPENVFQQFLTNCDINFTIKHFSSDYPKAIYTKVNKKWAYVDMDKYAKPWALEVGCKYLIIIDEECANLTFTKKKVNVGDYIKLNINIVVNNDNEDILPCIIKIGYICRVDQELRAYPALAC